MLIVRSPPVAWRRNPEARHLFFVPTDLTAPLPQSRCERERFSPNSLEPYVCTTELYTSLITPNPLSHHSDRASQLLLSATAIRTHAQVKMAASDDIVDLEAPTQDVEMEEQEGAENADEDNGDEVAAADAEPAHERVTFAE